MKYIFSFILSIQAAFALNPGDKAIDFTLKDQSGTNITLSSFKGKFIILEWFNVDCPYVKKHYSSKNMQTIQKIYQGNDEVVWLTINSSAKGKQGHIADDKMAMEMRNKVGMKSDYLLRDPSGKTGQAYGAKTTPHIFIIDHKFQIRYAGAIDSIASADTADIGKARNYITASMSKIMLQTDPDPAKTRAYGCPIKY